MDLDLRCFGNARLSSAFFFFVCLGSALSVVLSYVSIGHSFPPRRCRPIKILKQTKKKEEKLRRNLVHGVRCGITVSAATAGSTQDQRRTRNLVCTESSWKGVRYYCLVFRCLPQEQNTTRTDCRENEIHGLNVKRRLEVLQRNKAGCCYTANNCTVTGDHSS